MCHARKERVLLVGTRSADHIRASGHSGRVQRPYTWLHPHVPLKCPPVPLHRGRRPYMALASCRGDAMICRLLGRERPHWSQAFGASIDLSRRISARTAYSDELAALSLLCFATAPYVRPGQTADQILR